MPRTAADESRRCPRCFAEAAGDACVVCGGATALRSAPGAEALTVGVLTAAPPRPAAPLLRTAEVGPLLPLGEAAPGHVACGQRAGATVWLWGASLAALPPVGGSAPDTSRADTPFVLRALLASDVVVVEAGEARPTDGVPAFVPLTEALSSLGARLREIAVVTRPGVALSPVEQERLARHARTVTPVADVAGTLRTIVEAALPAGGRPLRPPPRLAGDRVEVVDVGGSMGRESLVRLHLAPRSEPLRPWDELCAAFRDWCAERRARARLRRTGQRGDPAAEGPLAALAVRLRDTVRDPSTDEWLAPWRLLGVAPPTGPVPAWHGMFKPRFRPVRAVTVVHANGAEEVAQPAVRILALGEDAEAGERRLTTLLVRDWTRGGSPPTVLVRPAASSAPPGLARIAAWARECFPGSLELAVTPEDGGWLDPLRAAVALAARYGTTASEGHDG